MRNLFLSLALALALVSPAGAVPVAGVAAVVNGDMITVRDLERTAAPEIAANKLNPKSPGDAARIKAVMQKVLDGMITEKILLQEAARQKIEISDSAVDKEIDRIIGESQLSREVFMAQVAQQGLTPEALRERLRSNLITQQLLGRMVLGKVVVTQDEINAYYRGNGASLPVGQARLALIVYPAQENAESWAKRIASGQISFADAARKISVGPNPQGGGDLGLMSMDDLAPALREAAAGLKPGQTSALFTIQLNKAQIHLIEMSGAQQAASGNTGNPDAATSARIEDLLRRSRLESRFDEYTKQLRAKALVDIRY